MLNFTATGISTSKTNQTKLYTSQKILTLQIRCKSCCSKRKCPSSSEGSSSALSCPWNSPGSAAWRRCSSTRSSTSCRGGGRRCTRAAPRQPAPGGSAPTNLSFPISIQWILTTLGTAVFSGDTFWTVHPVRCVF